MASSLKTSIYAGLVAGTVDIGAACLINRVMPGPVLRFITSGLLGTPLPHELWVYCLGMFLQWSMSIIIAGIFVLAANRLPLLLRRSFLAGIGYGVFVFVVMTFVVVPLSRAKSGPVTALSLIENLLAMMIFGLIVAYIVRLIRSPGSPATF
jgi:hypothetical protein